MIRVLGEPFEKLNIYTEVKEWLASGDGFVNVTGTTGEGTDRVFMMQGFGDDASVRLVLTYNDRRAEELYSDMKFYGRDVYMYPANNQTAYGGSSASGNGRTMYDHSYDRCNVRQDTGTVLYEKVCNKYPCGPVS